VTRVTIYADDLTGALDTAVKFTGGARRARVTWAPRSLDCDVLALDMETRDAKPRVAARLAAAWIGLARGLTFKKMDSTLRGPFAVQALALAKALRLRGPLFAPALPDSGRAVVGGRLLLYGEPLEKTAYADDPRCPPASGDLVALVGAASGKAPALLGLEVVRRGAAAVRSVLAAAQGAIVADAESEADLRVLAEALLVEREWLPVGSAGLAQALAAALGWEAASCQRHRELPELVVCGSGNPVSQAQARHLAEATGLPLLCPTSGGPESLISLVVRCHARRGLAILAMPEEHLGWHESRMVLAALATCTATALRTLGVRCFSVTGGETLRLIADQLGLLSLEPLCELAPGVVLSQAQAPELGELRIISKAGGFGGQEILSLLCSPGPAALQEK